MLKYHVVLDVLQSGVQQTVTGFYCGDTEKKQLCITLVRQGERYAIPSGSAAAFTAVKPDQTVVSHPCTLIDGQLYYVPTEQTLASEGTVHCQIIVYGADHSVLFSPQFDLQVQPPLVGEAPAASTDEFAFLPVSVLANLADADGTLIYQDQAVGGIENVALYYDLPLGSTGQLAFVHTGDSTHPRGFYRFGTQWEHLAIDTHSHDNLAVLQMLQAQDQFLCINGTAVGGVLTASTADNLPRNVPNGQLAYLTATHRLMRRQGNDWYTVINTEQLHTHSNKTVLDAVTSAVVSDAHTHANASVLSKWSEDAQGRPLYNGNPVAAGDDDTLVPLALGVTYDTLLIRDGWQHVPIYVTDALFDVGLYDQTGDNGIQLIETTDYVSGMPMQLLCVYRSGTQYACYPAPLAGVAFDYAAGWYDGNDPCNAPSLAGMQFTQFVCGNDVYTDLSDLPAKAQSALDTLSRMVNVSTDAMGDLRVPDGAVLRFSGTLAPNRHYDFITSIPFTLTLPEPAFDGKACAITVDLDCTRDNVTVTLPREKLLDGGVLPDTRRGHHTLTFDYIPAAGKWSVGCVNRVEPQYWDDIPDQVIPLEDCTWAQIKSIAEHGYVNRQGQWCIRRDNQEEVWFEIGDEKTVVMSTNETWTLQIWDFKHDDLADGSGKAPFTFGMKDVTANAYMMNTTMTTEGGWEASYLRLQTVPSIFATLPDALQTVISPVTKISEVASGSSTRVTSTDTLFIPSWKEIMGSGSSTEDTQYAINITDKRGAGSWLRSIRGGADFYIVSPSGEASGYRYMAANATTVPARFAFCI